jgi:hypothetical protein
MNRRLVLSLVTLLITACGVISLATIVLVAVMALGG